MPAYADEAAPVIVEAMGFELIDTDGTRYLDGHSSLWCNIHGHRVPELDAALLQQAGRVAHSTLLGLGNVPSIELAEALLAVAPPGLSQVFYADCGAAGVEVALKLAWQFHRQKRSPEHRDLMVSLGCAYHGDTIGTISVGGVDRFRSLFGGLMFPALTIPTPATWPGDPRGAAAEQLARQETEALLTAHADRIAAVVIEPRVQAAAGILIHPPGYLRWLRDLTQRLGILLIADEIAVGFGRLGTLLACEQEQVTPDLLVLSKGLTGGYLPLAATLVTPEIAAAFDGPPWAGRTFYHGHTYTGNPLACAVALASLRRIASAGVLAQAQCIQQRIAHQLVTPIAESPVSAYVAVRHCGTMVGCDLRANVTTGASFPAAWRVGHQVMLACRRRGVILRNIGDVVVLMPAPAMPLELVDRLCDVVKNSLQEVLAAGWKE